MSKLYSGIEFNSMIVDNCAMQVWEARPPLSFLFPFIGIHSLTAFNLTSWSATRTSLT